MEADERVLSSGHLHYAGSNSSFSGNMAHPHSDHLSNVAANSNVSNFDYQGAQRKASHDFTALKHFQPHMGEMY